MIRIFSALAVVAAIAAPTSSFASSTADLRVTLQASLQRSLDRLTIDGAIKEVNFETGDMEVFYPVDTHPMIVQMGAYFVLCSDLKRPDGTSVEVDYYLARKGERFALVQTEIDNREALRALMSAGKAHVLK